MKKDINIYVRKETITADCLHLCSRHSHVQKFEVTTIHGVIFYGVPDAAAVTTPKLFKAPWKKINKPAGAAASGAAVVAGVAPAKFGTSAEMFSNPGTLFNFASNIKRAVSRREMLQDTEFNLSC